MGKVLNQWVVQAAAIEAVVLSSCGTEASVSSWVKWGDRCRPCGHVAVVGETWQADLHVLWQASTPLWGVLRGNVEALSYLSNRDHDNSLQGIKVFTWPPEQAMKKEGLLSLSPHPGK